MASAQDTAYGRILKLQQLCLSKDGELERLSSAARISFEMGGIQLESVIAQLSAFVSRAAELDTAGLLQGQIPAFRDASICAISAVAEYAKQAWPGTYERIKRKYGDLAHASDAIKP